MAEKNIINKLKRAKLLGRSGSGFSAGLKWEMVKKERAKKKYIICNAASGEPKVMKDECLLKNHAKEVVDGIKIALKTIDNSEAYIYLRKDLYARFKKDLEKLVKGMPATFFKKPGGYLAGEETCICEAIEGRRPEPRIKPPFPTKVGLFGCPTLINNVETFYQVSRIAKGQYRNKRFYTVDGNVKNKGVYELPLSWSIERVLKGTGNWPDFDFFIQAGGGASGEILLPKELKKPVDGPGAIIVYNRKNISCLSLMKEWADFFVEENCDKCTPCREGIYRISEMINKKKFDKKLLDDISYTLETTSFCGLGKAASTPFNGLIKKICR